jgi:hypothetical protein
VIPFARFPSLARLKSHTLCYNNQVPPHDSALRVTPVKWLLDFDPTIRCLVIRDLTDADPGAIAAQRSRRHRRLGSRVPEPHQRLQSDEIRVTKSAAQHESGWALPQEFGERTDWLHVVFTQVRADLPTESIFVQESPQHICR